MSPSPLCPPPHFFASEALYVTMLYSSGVDTWWCLYFSHIPHMDLSSFVGLLSFKMMAFNFSLNMPMWWKNVSKIKGQDLCPVQTIHARLRSLNLQGLSTESDRLFHIQWPPWPRLLLFFQLYIPLLLKPFFTASPTKLPTVPHHQAFVRTDALTRSPQAPPQRSISHSSFEDQHKSTWSYCFLRQLKKITLHLPHLSLPFGLLSHHNLPSALHFIFVCM